MDTKILDNALVKITSQINKNESEQGSGCLFKYPDQDSKFVVLVTAKHCIYGKNDEVPIDSPNIKVTYQRGETTSDGFKIKEPPLTTKRWGDIAFYIFKESELCKKLKINQLKLHGFEVIKRKPTEIDSICFFRGYPAIVDNPTATTLKGEYRDGTIRNKFTIESLSSRGKDTNISGMSGCGVFMNINGNISLIGIVAKQDRFQNIHCISLASIYNNPTFNDHFQKIKRQAIFDSWRADISSTKGVSDFNTNSFDKAKKALDKIQNFDIKTLDNTAYLENEISKDVLHVNLLCYKNYHHELKKDFEAGKYEECLSKECKINPNQLPYSKEKDKIRYEIQEIKRKSKRFIEKKNPKEQKQTENNEKKQGNAIPFFAVAVLAIISIPVFVLLFNQTEEDQNKFNKCIKNANFLIENEKETYQIIAKCYKQAHLLRPNDSLKNKAIRYDSLYYQMILDQRKLGYESNTRNPKIIRNHFTAGGKQVFKVERGYNNPKHYEEEFGWYSEDTIQVPAMFSDIRKSDKKGVIEVRIIGSEKIWIEVDTSGNCLNCWEIDLE